MSQRWVFKNSTLKIGFSGTHFLFSDDYTTLGVGLNSGLFAVFIFGCLMGQWVLVALISYQKLG